VGFFEKFIFAVFGLNFAQYISVALFQAIALVRFNSFPLVKFNFCEGFDCCIGEF